MINRGSIVEYNGKKYKVLNIRTDRHNGEPITTVKLQGKRGKNPCIAYCVPIEELKEL